MYSNGYKQGQIDCINGDIKYVVDSTNTVEYVKITD